MSLHFTPWVALVLGLLAGWVLEWLLELFLLRRRRLACQLRLAEAEAQLKARDTDLQGIRAHIASLETDLAGRRARISAAAAATGAGAQRLAGRPGVTKIVSCPQDLSRIQGVGTVYEQRLYAAGIGSYWDLSQAADELLKTIVTPEAYQDLPAIKAEALRLARETGSTGYSWDGSQPDDFEKIGGIGEVYESRLYQAGICTYRALAAATPKQLQNICKAPDFRRPPYTQWIAQAKRLSEEKK
jgi:predicted flap endonuclease-1-like 5' DNA nuclease